MLSNLKQMIEECIELYINIEFLCFIVYVLNKIDKFIDTIENFV